jgi:hypothetical protein
MKPKIKTIAVGGAFALLLSAGGVMIKKYNDKIKDLNTRLSDVQEQARRDKDEIGKYWRKNANKSTRVHAMNNDHLILRYGNSLVKLTRDVDNEISGFSDIEKRYILSMAGLTYDIVNATHNVQNIEDLGVTIAHQIHEAVVSRSPLNIKTTSEAVGFRRYVNKKGSNAKELMEIRENKKQSTK